MNTGEFTNQSTGGHIAAGPLQHVSLFTRSDCIRKSQEAFQLRRDVIRRVQAEMMHKTGVTEIFDPAEAGCAWERLAENQMPVDVLLRGTIDRGKAHFREQGDPGPDGVDSERPYRPVLSKKSMNDGPHSAGLSLQKPPEGVVAA